MHLEPLRPPASRRRRAWLALATALLLGGCAVAPTDPAPALAGARLALAPTGTLRVGVYPGSPTSMVRSADGGEMRGLSVDIGRELGRRLGVPVAIVVHPRVADVVAAMQRGDVDMTITNATAERGRVVDFSAPLLALELGMLVRPGSAVGSVTAMDQRGARIGVSQGSTSQGVLGARLSQATLVPMPTLDAATKALAAGQLDAFATNKAILFEMVDRVPGASVLEGRWGLEQLAIAVGKGRDAGLPYLRAFAESVRDGGEVRRAAERAGLRGIAPESAR